MYILKENIKYEQTIKKSKFITYLYKIDSIDEIKDLLDKIKKEYKDASHIVYAYIFENTFKYYDDKEPNSTAGLPIYNALNKMKLTNTLAIVIRYFGGIKLGTGGLSRAYSSSITNAINKDMLKEYIKQKKYFFETDYENEKLLENILKDEEIINKKYIDKITYEVLINEKNIDTIKNKLNNKIKMYE